MRITLEPLGIILIKCYLHMHVNILKPCVTTFFDEQAFAEHRSSRSWPVSKSAHNSYNHMGYLDQFLQNRVRLYFGFKMCPAYVVQSK